MKQMKHLLLLLLCAALILGGLPVWAAAGEPGVCVTSVAGRRGETVTVEVKISQMEQVAGGGFNLTYDPSQLTLLAVDKGALMTGMTSQINPNYRDDQARITFACPMPKTLDGVLVQVRFKISESADFDRIPITLDTLRLYNKEAANIPAVNTPGSVTVQAATLRMSNASCLAGQAVKLDVMLEGTETPCGGKFDIVYNSRMLTGGSVKEEVKVGDVGISLSWHIDEAAGRIKVSWAASEPVTETGKLCTVIFAVAETASGSTDVTFENAKFLDENTSELDLTEPKAGTVTVVDLYNPEPTLYVVGGSIDENNRAVVNVALDGAGLVCGGRFNLSFDTTLCTLLEAKPMMDCVAINAQTEGSLRVSWAEDSPALDHETVLQLVFQMPKNVFGVPLNLTGVVLKDSDSATVKDPVVHSGAAGIAEALQVPVVETRTTNDAVEVELTLYDAKFCSEDKTDSVSALVASYDENGKFLGAYIPESTDTFDSNGIARLSISLPDGMDADDITVFILDASNTCNPLAKSVSLGS